MCSPEGELVLWEVSLFFILYCSDVTNTCLTPNIFCLPFKPFIHVYSEDDCSNKHVCRVSHAPFKRQPLFISLLSDINGMCDASLEAHAAKKASNTRSAVM